MLVVLTGLSDEAGAITARDGLTILTGTDGLAMLEDAASDPNCKGLVSFGTAGGLRSYLKGGDVCIIRGIVTASSVYYSDGDWSQRAYKRATWMRGIARAWSGAVEVATTPVQKVVLGQLHNVATVDATAWAIAEAAERHHLPFLAIQAISDAVEQDAPNVYGKDVNASGVPNLGAIVQSLFTDPGLLLPMLEVIPSYEASIAGLRKTADAIGSGFAFTQP